MGWEGEKGGDTHTETVISRPLTSLPYSMLLFMPHHDVENPEYNSVYLHFSNMRTFAHLGPSSPFSPQTHFLTPQQTWKPTNRV